MLTENPSIAQAVEAVEQMLEEYRGYETRLHDQAIVLEKYFHKERQRRLEELAKKMALLPPDERKKQEKYSCCSLRLTMDIDAGVLRLRWSLQHKNQQGAASRKAIKAGQGGELYPLPQLLKHAKKIERDLVQNAELEARRIRVASRKVRLSLETASPLKEEVVPTWEDVDWNFTRRIDRRD